MLSGATCRSCTLPALSAAAVCPDFRRNCALSFLRHADLHQRVLVTHAPTFSASARRCGLKRSRVTPRAAPQDANGADTRGDFNLSEYVEAKVERGKEAVLAQSSPVHSSSSPTRLVLLQYNQTLKSAERPRAWSCSRSWMARAESYLYS